MTVQKHLLSSIILFTDSGAPTDGAEGTGAGQAEPGFEYLDTASGLRYVNVGTTTVPVWVPSTPVFNAGAPVSGTSGTGAGTFAAPNVILLDTVGKNTYVNEGTLASPYWTPVNFQQPNLLAYVTDFRDGAGKAIADTDATATIPGSGVRVHGQGVAETDSGLTVAHGEGGPVASLLTTDEVAHLLALSVGGTTPPYQPDTHKTLVVEALLAMDAALTDRAMFLGFLGTVADALDPAATGATVTITLVQDDLAGLFFDSGLTDADRLFAPHNKSDEAATIATTATGVDTGADMPAAGTYTRLRVEITADGTLVAFKDKVQIARIEATLDVDEECAPCLYVEANAAAVTTMLVKRFATWATRG